MAFEELLIQALWHAKDTEDEIVGYHQELDKRVERKRQRFPCPAPRHCTDLPVEFLPVSGC